MRVPSFQRSAAPIVPLRGYTGGPGQSVRVKIFCFAFSSEYTKRSPKRDNLESPLRLNRRLCCEVVSVRATCNQTQKFTRAWYLAYNNNMHCRQSDVIPIQTIVLGSPGTMAIAVLRQSTAVINRQVSHCTGNIASPLDVCCTPPHQSKQSSSVHHLVQVTAQVPQQVYLTAVLELLCWRVPGHYRHCRYCRRLFCLSASTLAHIQISSTAGF